MWPRLMQVNRGREWKERTCAAPGYEVVTSRQRGRQLNGFDSRMLKGG